MAPKEQELPWDLFDRCLLPVLFSHAAAVIVATLLHTFNISHISTVSLFLLFVSVSLAVVLFYHNLKVTAAGKGILLTDCDSQIGYTFARQLDNLGFTVYACFTETQGNEEARKLKEESSGRLHIVQLDVASEEQILAAADYVKNNLPQGAIGLWAIVNNASWATFGEVEWVPYNVFKLAVDVNLLSVVRISQVFLPLVRKTRGRIINLVSIMGRITSPNLSSYCACKFGVEAFSECLRLEMRHWGVDVVVVEPGTYTTGKKGFSKAMMLYQAQLMWNTMSEDARKDYGEDYFEKRVRSLEEFTKGPETDTGPVLRALSDAVARTFPLPRYTPITRAEKLQILVAEHLPRSVYDILYT
ncbi:hypothetical protein R5R35_000104 [Gryllus longicercus]|uniref:D-beta-hydroxybutyrate dehydrogenase, mitochondrial n=1 Tax=Gryllus longicercus TaxID=2509291 RepID=A0AAN9Z5Z3_9ORTH